MLISAQCHIGSKNCEKAMEPYVFKRRADGASRSTECLVKGLS
jgi:ribosomal protein S2